MLESKGHHLALSRLALLTAAWWGVLTALAFIAVPFLFWRLGSPVIAGPVAAGLFSILAWLNMGLCALLGLIFWFFKPLSIDDQSINAIYFVVIVAVAAAVQEAWVGPHIVSARALGQSVALWHRLGSGLVLLQWLGVGLLAWRLHGLSAKRCFEV